MEEYEKRFNGSAAQKAIKWINPADARLAGVNDERGALYAETAQKEILQRLRQELRNMARSHFRTVSDLEMLCRKYRTLGACDEDFVAWLNTAILSVLKALGKPDALCEPREDWERAHGK